MRVLAAGVMIALLTMPAYSEETAQQKIDREQKEKAVEIDKAYQKTIKNMRSDAPATTTKVDPWGNVRAPDPVPAKQNAPSKNSKERSK